MQRIVGIGKMVVSNNAEDTIKTFALASCIGVVAYSSFRKVGGMIHIALPQPNTIEVERGALSYYASTGIPIFVNKMCEEYGCHKSELNIRLYGGANSIRENDFFDVGRKNTAAAKKALSEMNLKFDDTHTGEIVSRTIELNLFTGEVMINYQLIKI